MSTDGVSNLGYLKGEDSNNTAKGQKSGGDSGKHENKKLTTLHELTHKLSYTQVNERTHTLPPSDSQVDYTGPSYPMGEVLSADIITKPFNVAAGSAKIPNAKFNPFKRRQSGILNVLAKQAKVYLLNQISHYGKINCRGGYFHG